jgi:cleavage and polyadenylation specificity factor subunit 1
VLELFVDEDGEPVDGYEFQQCEVVNSLELVTLRSVGSMSGLKDYIAVGTIISYGEDRPARGATYVFDVVETVAPTYDPAARYKLRLLVKDDCKGPITNVSDINGYLIIVMGLKLFIRSLEKDEWLITVAFLDTPYQLTSVQRLKNFLLLTDVHKSVWFVAFQEEPYRLVVISKDYNDVYQSCGSFLIREEDMTIIAAAKDGTLRLYDYAPSIPASQGGQKLLARCEFACDAEASCRMSLPGTASNDGGIATSNEVLFSTMNGSIQVLQPVDEEIFNVLHLLQGQLVRNVQHFAGLHPRAYRAVRNETSSRPLTRGILEGRLLAQFELLSRPKMEELAKLIPDLVDGADQLLRYIATLRSNWGAM